MTLKEYFSPAFTRCVSWGKNNFRLSSHKGHMLIRRLACSTRSRQVAVMQTQGKASHDQSFDKTDMAVGQCYTKVERES